MPDTPEEILRAAWPWLSSEYKKLDDNLRELSTALTDETASGKEREAALITSAQMLCKTIRACHKRDLFTTAHNNLSDEGEHGISRLQQQICEHLELILRKEEAVLVVAGLDPTVAHTLREEIRQIPLRKWSEDPLSSMGLDYQVALATEHICHRFPKTHLDFKKHKFKKLVTGIKARYGIVGGLTIAAANASVSVLVQEPMTITKLSKLIGVVFTAYSAKDA